MGAREGERSGGEIVVAKVRISIMKAIATA